MHVRQVLVKAELEKFQQYKEVYNALKKGKVNFQYTYIHCPLKMYTLAQTYLLKYSPFLEHIYCMLLKNAGSSLK